MSTAVDQLAKRLCADMVREVATRHGRSFIVTAFEYPDGDTVNLYLESRSGAHRITDAGTTRHKLLIDDREPSDARERQIRYICNSRGIDSAGGIFGRAVDLDRPGPDFVALCEAIVRISTIATSREEHRHSEFQAKLETLLMQRVASKRQWQSDWHDPEVDPKGVFRVDYHFNGKLPPRHLFRVSSPYKAAVVAAVSNLYEARGLRIPTMSVIDPDVKLGEIHIQRVSSASDKMVFGIEEDRILDFLLSKR